MQIISYTELLLISLISTMLPNDPHNLSWQSPIVSNLPWVESSPSTVWKCACVRTFTVFIPYPSRFGPGSRTQSSSTHQYTHSCTLWLHWRLISSSHTLWYMWYTTSIYGNVLYHSDRPGSKRGTRIIGLLKIVTYQLVRRHGMAPDPTLIGK